MTWLTIPAGVDEDDDNDDDSITVGLYGNFHEGMARTSRTHCRADQKKTTNQKSDQNRA